MTHFGASLIYARAAKQLTSQGTNKTDPRIAQFGQRGLGLLRNSLRLKALSNESTSENVAALRLILFDETFQPLTDLPGFEQMLAELEKE